MRTLRPALTNAQAPASNLKWTNASDWIELRVDFTVASGDIRSGDSGESKTYRLFAYTAA